MKWYDDTAYDETTGEGTIAFLDEERLWVQPEDEILLKCEATGLWAPATVAVNNGGVIEVYWPEHAENEVVPSKLLARTTRLPKEFLIHPRYNLKNYSKQLLAREQNNGNGHPPDSEDFRDIDVERLLCIRYVILLHDEFPGQAISLRSIKHRTVNEVLPALTLSQLALHDHSPESTRYGWWVKWIEWSMGSLAKREKYIAKFRSYGLLVEKIPAKTIEWVGSEDAYQALLYDFHSSIARFPEFKSYNNNATETDEPITLEMSDEPLRKKFDDFMVTHEKREKAAALQAEKHQQELNELREKQARETAELRREIAELRGTSAIPPDLSKEFKADLKALLEADPGRHFSTAQVRDAVVEKWGSRTDHLGLLQYIRVGDNRDQPRKDFRAIVEAALMELYQAEEIIRFVVTDPSPEPNQVRKNHFYWAAKQ